MSTHASVLAVEVARREGDVFRLLYLAGVAGVELELSWWAL